MPDIRARVLTAAADLSTADWNACAGRDNPFVAHEFFTSLEASGSAAARTGWQPTHIVVDDAAGVPIALATDCNPGTSPLTSPLLVMNMAATLFRLTVDECLAGMTREAARAMGLLSEIGTLEAGKRCDLAVWDIERPAELVYRMGFNPLHARVFGGQTWTR